MYTEKEIKKRTSYILESIEQLKQSERLYEDRLEETRCELVARMDELNKLNKGVDKLA